MNARAANDLIRAVRRKSLRISPPTTDRELLDRFAQGRDETAFAELVARHTGMVLGVCRRVLTAGQDAEDVCQAVFLVLARKAASGKWQPSVANWLYTTARHLAAKANRVAQRRAIRERRAAVAEAVEPLDRLTAREWLAVLDEELTRLPAIYREALVLCCLEGLSREDAAARLGCPAGTVKVRLERGRKRLESALTARGVALGLGLLTLVVTSPAGASPPRLVELILGSVSGSPSPAVAELAREVAVNGLLRQTRAALLALVGMAALGLAYAAKSPADPAAPPANARRPVGGDAAKPDDGEGEKGFTYSGRVLNPEGKPLAGAKVHICGLNRGVIEFVEKARSDAEGKFRFRVLREEFRGRNDREPGRHVWIGATAAGCGPAVRIASQPKDRESLTLWLAPEQIVTARVVDLQGKPIAGVNLGAYIRHSRQRADLRPVAFDAPDKEGDWTSNVMPHDHDLVTSVTDREGRCVLRGLGKDWLYDLSIWGPTIVRSHVQLVTRPEKPKLVSGTGLSDEKGNAPRLLRYGSDLVHVAEPSKPITGVLRDRVSGKPVPNTRVGKAWVRDGEAWGWTETDKDGRFRLDGLPRGRHKLTIEPPPPYIRTEFEARADQPGVAAFDCTIDLQPYQLVRGRVLDRATGQPVKGRVVYHPFADNPALRDAPLLAETRWPSRTAVEATLDKEGRFSVPALPGRGLILAHVEGPYRRASLTEEDRRAGVLDKLDPELFDTRPRPTRADDANAYRVVDVPTDKVVTRDLSVDPGRSLPLTVLDPDGKPLAVKVYGLMPEPGDSVQELKSGRGTIAALAPGERRKIFVRAKERLLAGHLTLRGDEREAVTLRLQPTGSVTGQLLDADGQPLVGEHFQIAYDADADRAGVLINTWTILRLLTKAEEARERRLFGFPDKRLMMTGSEKTDATGRFRIDGVVASLSFDLKVQLTRPSKSRPGAREVIGFVKVTRASVGSGQGKDLGTVKVTPAGQEKEKK